MRCEGCGGGRHADGLSSSARRTPRREIETYNDHRMAMCFAILGLKVPGIKLKESCVREEDVSPIFPKLAAAPPNGLGVEIRDGRTGRKLAIDELFAD